MQGVDLMVFIGQLLEQLAAFLLDVDMMGK